MPRSSLLALCLILPLSSLPACSGDGGAPQAGLEAKIDTVNGVPLLTYPDREGPELDWSLHALYEIGGYEQDGSAFEFDNVQAGGLAGRDDGSLFVLDGTGSRVLGYDGRGAPIGVWGREGGGPGELQMPGGLGIGPGDSLWVADRGNRRVTIFPPDPQGAPSDLSLADATAGLGGSLAVDAGGLYGVAVMFSFRPGEEVSVPPQLLLRVTREGRLADTVWAAPPREFDQVELTSGGSVMVMLMQRRFTPGFYWDRFANGDFAVADGADYEIAFAGPDGGEKRRIRRGPPARAATEADRERVRRQTREQAEESGSEVVRQSVDQRIEKMTFAETVPWITGLIVDTQDRLWVGVSTEVPEETGRIDVYDRTGTLLGEVRDPPFFPDLFFADGRAVHLDRDELDVQTIAVLQLREGAAD